MKSEARNRLRSIVGKARKLVEEDIRLQLLRLGIKESELIPIGRLEHLDDALVENRRRIEEAIHKEKLGNLSEKEGFERYVRHVGFTFINRVAAFKAMEVRNLLSRETVTRREKYAGYSAREYEVSEREGINDPGEIAEIAFRKACDEISEEISVLFDLSDEYSILFPSTRVLTQVYEYFGKDIPAEDWLSDDVIGWIYQYYNSEARKKFRKKKRKPRPDDIPIINQFYTSDWIVKALVDNTLGRLWLESRGEMYRIGEGTEKSENGLVKGYCDYIIPEKDEHKRDIIKPHEVKVLDPACGSGHFLVYAFDVLFRMYQEYDSSLSDEKICELIIENNLYGIDIDLRAVQLAALSLYLKAKKLSSKSKIRKMNLVCADARILDGSAKRDFLRKFKTKPQRHLQRAFAKLFDDLTFTYHIGSLFRIREQFEDIMDQTSLPSFIGDTESTTTEDSKPEEQSTFDEMLAFLKRFEKEAMETHDMGTLLFATEIEKSAGLISLLTQKYDVVVMNPPYGDAPKEAKGYLKKQYPRTHYDYYSAFMEQAINLCKENGFVGMLTGRTFMFLKWFERVRKQILYENARPVLVLDLNASPSDAILDEATARWAATVARVSTSNMVDSACQFFRLTTLPGEEGKKSGFQEAISFLSKGEEHDIVYRVLFEDLRKLPRMPYSYWVPREIADLFSTFPPLDRDNAGKSTSPKISDLKQGLATADDSRFVRFRWEVDFDNIAQSRDDTIQGKKWVPFTKGGGAYYSDAPLVVNWQNDGQELRDFASETGKPRIQNESYYFKGGIIWSDIVSSVLMDFRPLPEGHIFSVTTHSLFPEGSLDISTLIGIMNSSLIAACFLALDPTLHHRHIGYMCQMPVWMDGQKDLTISKFVDRISELKMQWTKGDEISFLFDAPWLKQQLNQSNHRGIRLNTLAQKCFEFEYDVLREIQDLRAGIDERVYELYGLQETAIKRVKRELEVFSGFLGKSQVEEIKPKLSKENHIERLMSYYVLDILRNDPDGVVSLDELVRNVRTLIGQDFGNDNLDLFETDFNDLVTKSVEQWLIDDFFSFHISVYKRHPIIWQISSRGFSSRKKGRAAFDCFLHYHKLDKDTLHKLRSKYLKAEIDATRWAGDSLRKRMLETEAADSSISDQLDEAEATLEELEKFNAALKALTEPSKNQSTKEESTDWFTEKAAEITVNGWSPVIDYGVRVNIKPLQVAGILHKAARRIK